MLCMDREYGGILMLVSVIWKLWLLRRLMATLAQAMRTQLAKLETRLEVETKEREDLRVHLQSERKAREDIQQHMERELQNFMKNWHPPNN
ncbi:hypothetical protein HanRHA438_Chr00c01g0842971 [Helianthus annuus]|nr:hypothetical protein HanRHA438_Chr00c01g0842971 [Helianthus annuus]